MQLLLGILCKPRTLTRTLVSVKIARAHMVTDFCLLWRPGINRQKKTALSEQIQKIIQAYIAYVILRNLAMGDDRDLFINWTLLRITLYSFDAHFNIQLWYRSHYVNGLINLWRWSRQSAIGLIILKCLKYQYLAIVAIGDQLTSLPMLSANCHLISA